ncbi:MAG: methyl-accepting chemotaxis protein [Proteobacteria bacterium]|nr:methyl-accepting chemotaxis protein [Pseudomonadota bacterium]
MFSNLKIGVRLYFLVVIGGAVMISALVFGLFHAQNEIVHERQSGLEMLDDTVLAVLNRYHQMEKSGEMTREQAQAAAASYVGSMRYDGGTGYFWINDMQPVMIMHPINPKLNGQNVSNIKDPSGGSIFDAFVKIVRENGSGFHEYKWPKPGSPEPVLKYSHVAGFQPWGWVIGTGVYADDLSAMFRKNAIYFGLVCLTGLVLISGVAWFVVTSVTRPIARIKHSMGEISQERVSAEVTDTDRKDEIGDMARALAQLKDSVAERLRLRSREAEQQRIIDAERASNEGAFRTAAERQSHAMHTLGDALERLAAGDLTAHVSGLDAEYRKLGEDFNATASALRQVITSIAESGSVVRDSAGNISEATGHLSRRTEQQAAALEETAAALDEISAAMRMASERSNEARDLVRATTESADRSGEIVRNAVDAMSRIEKSSTQINQIIGVIDEIAFQTNLLALNAGVEAARAGEAGKGFAVVAQEVRELAQRSAQAAKEIKTLISQSAHEVSTGVSLVRSTGEALLEIESLVSRVNEHVESIATAAREQSTGLGEINSSVNHMDQMTQQNAAMVEETTAASQTLEHESEQLSTLLARFRLDNGMGRTSRAA